jgi:xanthine dehydrogenase accessory factor
VTGSTPIAQALRAMAALLGYGVVDPAGRDSRTVDDLAGCSAVLLASHGPGEVETIRAALDAGVPYIGLVASRKRSAALFDEMGLDEAQRSRVHAPAGRWIGARTAPEIALSILADVVAAIRLDAGVAPGLTAQVTGGVAPEMTRPSTGAPAAPGLLTPVQAIDPVCGMTVTVMPDTPHARVDAVDYYFCNPGCRERFLADHADTATAR